MRFLLERKIVDDQNSAKITKALNARKYSKAADIIRKQYKEQFKHINSRKLENNYLTILLAAIEDFGLDTNTNPLLDFALSEKNTFDINKENIFLLDKIFRNNTITSDASWLHDPRAYDGDSLFKLKALIYLSTKRDQEENINKILDLKKESDIKEFLHTIQTSIKANSRSNSKRSERRDDEYYQNLIQRDLDQYGKIQPATMNKLIRAGVISAVR